jgi:hypothetical protein
MASYVAGIKQYGLAAMNTDIPPSLGSSSAPRPIPSSVQIVNLASQSGDQGPNGLISFQIPTGAAAGGYLKPNSVYLRGTCQLSATTTATVAYALQSKSASALINRMTCSVGGVQVSQINNYHLLHEMLITHAASGNYYQYDSQLLQSTNVAAAFAIGVTPTNNFVIPVINPLFNSEKAVPLFLLNAPIQLQFDINSIANAFKGANNDLTGFTLKNVQLVYEVLKVDSDYVNNVKMALGAGNLYQLNLRDFWTLTVASQVSLNYLIGGNFSSVRGVLYTNVNSVVGNLIDVQLNDMTQTNFRLMLDGRLINNFPCDTVPVQFAEMNRALGNLFDSNITSFVNSAANYQNIQFVGGLSCNRVSDNGMSMTGSSCQNINILLDSAGQNRNAAQDQVVPPGTRVCNTYIVVLFDQIFTIDVTGNVALVK